jgi:uncharacterized protein (TIGR03083 family)
VAPEPLPPIDAAPLVAELDARLLDLLRSLTDEEWARPTIAGAWTVRDVAAHLLDTALRRLSFARDGWLPPATIRSEADLVAMVNTANADGVRVLGRLSPSVLITLTAGATRELSEYLSSLDPAGPAAFPVSWAGDEASAHWFDVARELTERWHHQEQIRLAVGKPGIMTPRLYHPVLDCFLRALPHAYRDVKVPAGSRVQVVITGECGGVWTIERHAGGWRLDRSDAGAFLARVTVPQELAWRLFTKGLRGDDARRPIRIDGDEAVGAVVLRMVTIVG